MRSALVFFLLLLVGCSYQPPVKPDVHTLMDRIMAGESDVYIYSFGTRCDCRFGLFSEPNLTGQSRRLVIQEFGYVPLRELPDWIRNQAPRYGQGSWVAFVIHERGRKAFAGIHEGSARLPEGYRTSKDTGIDREKVEPWLKDHLETFQVFTDRP